MKAEQGRFRRRLAAAAGAIALLLLGVILTVSFDSATANGASYLRALGITGVPKVFQSSLAGTIFTIILTAIVSVVATTRITRWNTRRAVRGIEPEGRSNYDLYVSMMSLVSRMREYLKYEGFAFGGDANEIWSDCRSLNLTLLKQGFAVPYVPAGTAQSMFGLLGQYYTMLGPMLRDGHREQAMAMASSFTDDHPPPPELADA